MNMNNKDLMQRCGTRMVLFDKNHKRHSIIRPIINKADFDNAIICNENKNDAIKNIVKWNNLDDEWRHTIDDCFWSKSTYEEMKKIAPRASIALFKLKQRMLDFAGDETCLPITDDFSELILEYGQFWIGYNVRTIKGEPCHCHDNVCDVWQEHKDEYRICTGYGLSPDGMWRRHSWLIHMKPRSNQIIETTVSRIVYFGVVLTYEQCEKFCEPLYG